jgi:predicted glycosyltransferase
VISGAGVDAGQPQRPGVDHAQVPVVTAQEDGTIGDVTIDQGGIGQPAAEGAIVVPLAAEQPALARQAAVEGTQAFAELGLVAGILEGHLRQPQPGAEQVNVTVVKPRQHAPPVQMQHARLRANQAAHVGVAAHGEDASVPGRQRLGLGPGQIDRPDFAIEQHQVGGHGRRFRRDARQG